MSHPDQKPSEIQNEEIPQQYSEPDSDEVLSISTDAGIPDVDAVIEDEEEKRRKRLLLVVLFLLALLIGLCAMFYQYIRKPAPLPELLPALVNLTYPPHYLFSIYGVDKPVGVALSPSGDRIYVTESGGERLVRIIDREGDHLGSFAPPRTRPGERSPVYITTDPNGRVFVSDRSQHAVYIYDREGNYLDTMLGPDLTLSEYVAKHTGGLQPETTFAYNLFQNDVYYQNPGEAERTLPAPDMPTWAPLGVRFDPSGKMFVTDVTKDHNSIREISIPDGTLEIPGQDFDPIEAVYGESGKGSGQFLFPNAAVADSQGRVYVSDGNNGRISVWDDRGIFLFNFGRGSGEGSLSLPRGVLMDSQERLYVVDAVGQNVKVYDVSGDEPAFLFAFGDIGLGDGQFNYPNDIALDATGRLYIADRENNRIQVWSY